MEGFKDLLLRAKRGDEDAVEKLFVQYESLLHKCSRVNGHVDEDLYQVLLIEFWRAISEFKV
jgi:DNA-directed RNA polymerase specialized sigma24 family protein